MEPWFQAVIAVCIVALVAALVVTLLSLRRVAIRTDSVLGIVEAEIRPLVAESHALLSDVRGLTQQANREMERIGAVTATVGELAEGVSRIVGAVAGLTRAGQILKIALGLRKRLSVFAQRFTRSKETYS